MTVLVNKSYLILSYFILSDISVHFCQVRENGEKILADVLSQIPFCQITYLLETVNITCMGVRTHTQRIPLAQPLLRIRIAEFSAAHETFCIKCIDYNQI